MDSPVPMFCRSLPGGDHASSTSGSSHPGSRAGSFETARDSGPSRQGPQVTRTALAMPVEHGTADLRFS